jgi:hypothetical protein
MKPKGQWAQSKKSIKAAQMGCELSRRGFLSGCAACAAGLTGLSALDVSSANDQAPYPSEKAKVRLVFSHHREDAQGKQSEQGWPYLGYDLAKIRNETLEKLRKHCPNSEFLPAVAYSIADAQKILAEDKDQQIDGYLSYMLGGWAQAGVTFANGGKPTIYVGDLFGASGEILVAIADAKRRGLKAFGVTSSSFDDVVQAVRCFESLKRLRSSKILDVGADPGALGKAIQEVFGTEVMPITFDQLDEAYRKADRAQARQWAEKWVREAQQVVEPSQQEVEKSAAMYVAMRTLLNQQEAQAITINCLGGFYGGKMEAYPCLGHFQLNNDGLVGACESDLISTITMLLMSYLVGRPGYISDPVIDTSKNQIIYVHCVAPSKVFGPDGPTNPYHIRSHSEDRKGAAIRSLMPLGEMTTTLEFNSDSHKVIIHQGKAVANIDEDKACRTKLAAEPKGDINKLLKYWDQWGWHRVTFYGDLKRPVEHIAALLGFEIIDEA